MKESDRLTLTNNVLNEPIFADYRQMLDSSILTNLNLKSGQDEPTIRAMIVEYNPYLADNVVDHATALALKNTIKDSK